MAISVIDSKRGGSIRHNLEPLLAFLTELLHKGSLFNTYRSGTYCETPRGVWSSWTQSTECREKSCGISRYRWRRRQCLNDTTYIKDSSGAPNKKPCPCFGISEEVTKNT
ncbi:hypothetical protein TSMEX_004030 [Taenia solium]|eukprot:TsM_000138000 transcript=TsM_000138000 gene=TsM_000138000